MRAKLCLGLNSQFGINEKEQIALIKETGFDGYFLNWKSEINVKELKEYGDKLGLICQSMHAPFTKMEHMWEQSPITEETVNELIFCVEECEGNQIPILVCHCFKGFGPEMPNELGVKNFEKVVKKAKELGVKIAFENTEGEAYLDTLMEAFKDYEHVGFCWLREQSRTWMTCTFCLLMELQTGKISQSV